MAETVDQLSSEDLFRAATAEAAVEPEPAPAEAEPAITGEPPVEPKPEAPKEAPPGVPPEATIPSWRLREEADARRAAEDRVRLLEERLTQISAHLQQTQKQPDFFENPDQATQTLIMRTLQPYAEETRKTLMAMGRMVAGAVHGAEKVDEAERAFLEAREKGSLDPADYERVVNAPNRYDAAVQWHRRQAVLTSVGDDPQAWFDQKLEAMMNDPAFQAKLIEKTRASAAGKPQAIKVPPSLSKSTSVANAAGEPVGDMSDASLFAYAMKR